MQPARTGQGRCVDAPRNGHDSRSRRGCQVDVPLGGSLKNLPSIDTRTAFVDSVVTTRDATHPGRRARRLGVAGALAAGALACASLAFGAASFSDPAGDDNAAPDVTSVAVSETPEGTLTLVVGVGNHQTLPANSWFNLWFDLDSNPQTGDEGDEALIRYFASGELELFSWDGANLVERSSAGVAARYDAGVLTLTAPESALATPTAFGVLVVSVRGQEIGDTEFIASDFAPDRGRTAYVGPAPASFPDPRGDQDAAPDITSVRVTDAKDGWISFAISTPNYATLPGEAVLVVAIDSDNRVGTGENGSEALITTFGGEIRLERWDTRKEEWVEDARPSRIRLRNSANVVTIDIHGSELGSTARFGFAVTAADLSLGADNVLGIDVAPEGAAFWKYTVVNRPALVLTKTQLFVTPAQPRAGRPFTVSLGVRRSDTGSGIATGRVGCSGRLDGKRIVGRGSVLGGRARCTFLLPKSAAGRRLSGTISVHVDGKSVAANFAYAVR